MTHQKLHVMETLLSEKKPEWMQLEEIAETSGTGLESTRTALLDLQEDELVFLRNGWYTASAVARQKFA